MSAVQAAAAAARTALGPLKQIDAGVLNIGYVEAGPAAGPPVVLLHGWPYDIHAFADVSPVLASAGYRVVVPYLRGYGTTTFLSSESFRNGQPSELARDATAFTDALGHNLPQEAPQAFAQAILDVDQFAKKGNPR